MDTITKTIPRPKFKSAKFAGTEDDVAVEAAKVKAEKEARKAKALKARTKAVKKAPLVTVDPVPVDDDLKRVAGKIAAKLEPKLSKHETRAANIPAPTVTVSGNIGPGVEIATELQQAFTHLNKELFGDKVEPCVVVVSKLRRSYGHFWHSAFARRADLKNKVHEIGIDFRRLAAEGHKNDIDVLSTIAHEMAHALVFQIDKAEATAAKKEFKPKTYHCGTWAALMNKIGLKPVAIGRDGQPNGKETGQKATHEIVKGGPFEVAAKALLDTGFKLSWSVSEGFYDDNGRPLVVKIGKGGKIEVGGDGEEGEPKPKKKRAGAKAVHVCPDCGSKAWGRPAMVVLCSGTKDEPHVPAPMECDREAYEAPADEGDDE